LLTIVLESKMLFVFSSKNNQESDSKAAKKKEEAKLHAEKQVTQVPTAMFFQYNTQLGPPYHVLVDTNFINFSIKNKLEIYKSMMDCLLAKCIPCITDCVMAELEKLGSKYRLALRLAKDPRFERLPCTHGGTYADDCLLQRCQQHRCYIVATCDKELKRKIRKVIIEFLSCLCLLVYYCFFYNAFRSLECP
jgi:U3 small nucleolar RNA-associated protein 24